MTEINREQMETAVKEKNATEFANGVLTLVSVFFASAFPHVDAEKALETFREKTGTAESHELDDFFQEILESFINEENGIEEMRNDSVGQNVLSFLTGFFQEEFDKPGPEDDDEEDEDDD